MSYPIFSELESFYNNNNIGEECGIEYNPSGQGLSGGTYSVLDPPNPVSYTHLTLPTSDLV